MNEQDIKITLARMETQLHRIVSDIESEKETRKKRNEDIDKRLRDAEMFIESQKGKESVTNKVIAFLLTIIAALVIWLITKK